MNKLEKLFGLGGDDDNDQTERVDDTAIATEMLPTDRVGTGAFDPTDVAGSDLATGFEETQMAPGSVFPHTKAPRSGVPRAPALKPTNRHAPKPPQTYLGPFEDPDDDDDDHFDQTDVAPITVGDVAATMLGAEIDDRFRLHGILGEGGMGRVYRGEQISIGRPVAIKVIKRDLAQQEDIRKRFLREAKVISNFSHPNIVRLIDFGELQDGRLYLAMEFVNGKPISDLFLRKKVHPRYALEMTRQIASALIEAHAMGVIHRDLKPDNIFLTRIADGSIQFKVLDFGVARTSASTLTAKGAVCGTPAYMAPEQARGLEVDGTTDLYSLGVMLFEALTGQLPFSHPDPFKLMLKQCQDAPPSIQNLAPHVPNDVVEVVESLLSKKGKDRIATSAQLCDTIEFVMQNNGWGGTIRIHDGPLEETTQDWLWTSATAAAAGMLQGNSDWLMGELDLEPATKAAPEIDKYDDFESIELDLPRVPETPPLSNAIDISSSPSLEPVRTRDPYAQDETAEVPPRPQTRMERRMTPAASHVRQHGTSPAATVERRAPRSKKKNNNNQILVLVLVGLLLIAGGLGAYVMVFKKGPPTTEQYITSPAVAHGSAQNVFRAIQDDGWQLTQPNGSQHAGITTFTANAMKDKAVVKITVDEYNSKDDAGTQFRTILSGVYWFDKTVVDVKPQNAIATTLDAKAVLNTLVVKMPGGKLTP